MMNPYYFAGLWPESFRGRRFRGILSQSLAFGKKCGEQMEKACLFLEIAQEGESRLFFDGIRFYELEALPDFIKGGFAVWSDLEEIIELFTDIFIAMRAIFETFVLSALPDFAYTAMIDEPSGIGKTTVAIDILRFYVRIVLP